MLLFGDPLVALFRLLALIPALVLHEFAHGYSAYRMGDPTPRLQGRLTLNPLAHLDPIGTLMILIAPIGWAKPVQINPYNFRDAARGMMLSTACGPLSNFAQAVLFGMVLRVLLLFVNPYGNLLTGYLGILVGLNLALAFFNLIPLGPLDGHHIAEYFLPYPTKVRYANFNRQYGMFILLMLIVLGFAGGLPILSLLVLKPADALGTLIVGVSPWAAFAAGLR